jgi:hypothetical protein
VMRRKRRACGNYGKWNAKDRGGKKAKWILRLLFAACVVCVCSFLKKDCRKNHVENHTDKNLRRRQLIDLRRILRRRLLKAYVNKRAFYLELVNNVTCRVVVLLGI